MGDTGTEIEPGDAGRVTGIYLWLGFVFGFIMSCFGLAATVAWVTEADLSATQLILMGTVLEATVLLFEVPTGVVADRISRKWSIVLSYALIAVGISGSLSTTFWVLMVAQFVWGVGFTFQSGAVTAWATDQLGRHIDDLIVKQARMRSAGVIVGVVAGAALGSTVSLFAAIGLAVILAVVVALTLAIVMPEAVKPSGDDVAANSLDTARNGWNAVKGYPLVRLVMLVAFIGGFGSEVIDRLSPFAWSTLVFPRSTPCCSSEVLRSSPRLVHGWCSPGCRARSRSDRSVLDRSPRRTP